MRRASAGLEMKKVKNIERKTCEIRLDEPCRLGLVLCVCCLLFETSGELLFSECCPLIHLCASTPAEGCGPSDRSGSAEWKSSRSLWVEHGHMNSIGPCLLRNSNHEKVSLFCYS